MAEKKKDKKKGTEQEKLYAIYMCVKCKKNFKDKGFCPQCEIILKKQAS